MSSVRAFIALACVFLCFNSANSTKLIRCDTIFCPEIYQPVCAYNGHEFKTFPNLCRMNVYNCINRKSCYRKIAYGECCSPDHQPEHPPKHPSFNPPEYPEYQPGYQKHYPENPPEYPEHQPGYQKYYPENPPEYPPISIKDKLDY